MEYRLVPQNIVMDLSNALFFNSLTLHVNWAKLNFIISVSDKHVHHK